MQRKILILWTLLLVVLISFFPRTGQAQTASSSWTKTITGPGIDRSGKAAVGKDGNIYTVSVFVEKAITNGILTSADATNAFMVLVKQAPNGDFITSSILPMDAVMASKVGAAENIKVINVVLSPDGSRIGILANLSPWKPYGTYIVCDTNGTVLFKDDFDGAVFTDVVFDNQNKSYLSGHEMNGILANAFLRKYTNTGVKAWEIKQPGQNKAFNVYLKDTTIFLLGHHKGSFTVSNSLGGNAVTLPDLSGWPLYQLQYSTNGVLLSAKNAPGIVPEFPDQEPVFVSDVSISGTWNIVWNIANHFGWVNIFMQQMDLAFSASNPGITGYACSFAGICSITMSASSEEGVIAFSGYCKPLAYHISAKGKVLGEIKLPALSPTTNGNVGIDLQLGTDGTLYGTYTAVGPTSTDDVFVSNFGTSFYVTPPSTGIITTKTTTVSIYPNPAINEISISGIPDNTPVQITDMQGRVVLKQTISTGTLINITDLSSGLFFINLGNQGVMKFTKN